MCAPPHKILFGLTRGLIGLIFVRSFDVVQREGCPKIVNLGSSKTDLFYERKKYGFKKR
jgi:hypothetical protein